MDLPDFRSPDFLLGHIRQTLAFYYPRCVDATGGFYHFFKDDGTVYDHSTRHLVSSTRFIFNFAMASRQFGRPEYLEATRHGLHFLRTVHRDADTGGYAWVVRWGPLGNTPGNSPGSAVGKTVVDDTNHCYGLAFVLLAHAHALMAGVEEARSGLAETYDLMEKRFWEAEHGLYADEASASWQVRPYRGQNANMHACEAMLAAFEATGETRYLDRAETLATSIVQRQAALAGGLIWEHYHDDWSVDWDYNRDDKTNIFRPWGYQPGHFAEWAKLLLILERHRPGAWLLPHAQRLLEAAVDSAWDSQHGGLFYGVSPDRSICDDDKYFWVQAEALAAAALMAARSGEARWWEWYQSLWAYSWTNLVDHDHGAWYRILRRNNSKYSDEKSPAGKVDYHTMGACYDVLKVVRG